LSINKKMSMLMLAAALNLNGCSTFTEISDKFTDKISDQTSSHERDFAGALQYLRNGKEQKAIDLFEHVVAGSKIPGITDEALFRLSVLLLRDSSSKGMARSEKHLERLKKEFPQSIWRHQAEPLLSFIDSSWELRKSQKELRTLRDLNVSLTKNNRELRQTIERLKELDIELEQKIRR
jgi:hypothetical protein